MSRASYVLLLLLGPSSLVRADDFALRDGDTVVFLGDSITAARTYGKVVENYTLLRFPDRKVRFVNAGRGGDTAAGGLKRLERDVLAHKPTVVTVAYGVNDIGWGMKADEAHKTAYLAGIRGIVEACQKRGVRVYVCSAAVTAEDPAKADEGFLQTMCDEGMALSRSLGGHAIDVQRTMRGIQRKVLAANDKVADKTKRDSLHAPDGVHLTDLGQLAMAFAILKGLGAPADVSSVRDRRRRTEAARSGRVQGLRPAVGGWHAGVHPTRPGAAVQPRHLLRTELPLRPGARRVEPLPADGGEPARWEVRGHGRRPQCGDVHGGATRRGGEHRVDHPGPLAARRAVERPGQPVEVPHRRPARDRTGRTRTPASICPAAPSPRSSASRRARSTAASSRCSGPSRNPGRTSSSSRRPTRRPARSKK